MHNATCKTFSKGQPCHDVGSDSSRGSDEGESGESLAREKGGGKCGQRGTGVHSSRVRRDGG